MSTRDRVSYATQRLAELGLDPSGQEYECTGATAWGSHHAVELINFRHRVTGSLIRVVAADDVERWKLLTPDQQRDLLPHLEPLLGADDVLRLTERGRGR